MQGEANIVWTAVCMWHLYVRVRLSAVSDSVEVCVEGLLLPTADRDIQRSFVSVSQCALPAIIDAAVGPVPVPEHTIVTYLHLNIVSFGPASLHYIFNGISFGFGKTW